MLGLFSALKQNKFPYHVPKVDSNDVLYSGDSDYEEELQSIVNKLIEEILDDLSKLKEMGSGSSQVKKKKLIGLTNHLNFFFFLLYYRFKMSKLN
jgi:hypothetical protein